MPEKLNHEEMVDSIRDVLLLQQLLESHASNSRALEVLFYKHIY